MESDMTQRSVPVLAEALSDKDALIPSQHKASYDRAEQEWGDIATTNQGKLAVISAAKAGEELALLFLLKKAFEDGRVKKLLWRFLGPNATFQKQRIAAGDTATYRSIVTESLIDILDYWNLSKVPTGVDYFVSLMKLLSQKVQTNITRYNIENNRSGVSGRILKSKGEVAPQISSYEAYTDTNSEIESEHDQFRGTENLDAWQSFIDDEELDAGRTPTSRDVLRYFLRRGDFDVNAAAKVFGKTNMTIRTKLAAMKDILERHGVTQEAFQVLLLNVGAKELASTLGGSYSSGVDNYGDMWSSDHPTPTGPSAYRAKHSDNADALK